MRLGDTTAARLSRGAAVLLAAALCWAASGTTSYSQSSADTGARGRSVGTTVNLPGVTTLSGHVEDEAGKPVARAVVALGNDSVLTSDDGQFVLQAPPGAYLLTIRRLGFRVERFAVSLTAGEPRDVTVVVARFVPVLPTVTTTAKERAAYLSVGFEQRMRAGIGQFLTYEQIVHEQASYFTDLLHQMRGITVKPGADRDDDLVVGTRGPGSCVTYVIDGAPQQQILVLPPSFSGGPAAIPGGPESPNHWVQPNDVGAVEVYGPSERPSGFGSDQSCNLIMIWTRARLGLTNSPTARSASGTPATSAEGTTTVPDVTRGVAVVANGGSCTVPMPADTVDLVVYATVEGVRPDRISDTAWASYKAAVLDAVDRSATLPSQLVLPVFSIPLSDAGEASGHGSGDLRVAPTLSNLIQFTLDTGGAVTSTHVAASSLSGSADTTALAIVERAGATRAFPRLPSPLSGRDSAQLFLVIASIEPAVGTRAAVIGQLEVPTWHLARAAQLAGAEQPHNSQVSRANAPRGQITLEAVVNDSGRVIRGTLRVIGGLGGTSWGSLVDRALALQFEPALIGNCPVPELVLQPLPSS